MESVNHGVPFHCSKYKISLSELIQWLFDVLFPFFIGSGIDSLQMLRLREANFQFSKAKFLVFGPSSSPTLEVLEVSRKEGSDSDDEASSCFSDGLDSRP